MAGGKKRVLQCRCRATSCAGSQECVTMPLRMSVGSFPSDVRFGAGSHDFPRAWRFTARPVARLAALHLGRRSLAGSPS
eukprot:6212050-Pleurochrysis_carterae.AAC.5